MIEIKLNNIDKKQIVIKILYILFKPWHLNCNLKIDKNTIGAFFYNNLIRLYVEKRI